MSNALTDWSLLKVSDGVVTRIVGLGSTLEIDDREACAMEMLSREVGSKISAMPEFDPESLLIASPFGRSMFFS